MTVSHWSRTHAFTTPDHTTDVLILGAGFAGLSTAFWLSEMRPDLRLTLLERSTCGAGASGRNAGFITKGSAHFYKGLFEKWGRERALSLYGFAEDSLRLFHQEILKSSPEVKFERTSSTTLMSQEMLISWKKTEFRPEDFSFQWRPSSEMPLPLQKTFEGGLENESEYKLNPLQLMISLKKRLESRKVQIMEGVSGFEITADAVLTEVNTIRTKNVVLAMNGYFPEFHDAFRPIITPTRAQMLAVELEEDVDLPSLYYDPPERVYWRKGQDKTLLIGGKRTLDEKREKGNFDRISPKIQHGLEDYLQKQLNMKYKVIKRWSGIMGFTKSELPFVTKVSAPMNTIALGGFSGHGMGFGFKAGQEAAALIAGDKSTSFFDSFEKVNIGL